MVARRQCHMELSKELAKDFNKSALTQCADHAAMCARIMLDECNNAPWRMTDNERDALDTFRQFAAYTRRIIDML
jgi:hypothetical protein